MNNILRKILFGLTALAGIILTVLIFKNLNVEGDPLKKCFELKGLEYNRDIRAIEAAKKGIWQWEDTKQQKQQLQDVFCSDDLGFGVATDFQQALAAPMTATQDFVPLTSLSLRSGVTLTMSMLGSKVFLTLEPGSTKEELVMCTNIDTTTRYITGCTRGLAFSGTSTAAVTANQKTHSSGATVVMSNVHYVYNQYLDKNAGNQYVSSTVQFEVFPSVTSVTALPTAANELASKYYVDNVGAGGFTASNVSTTRGLSVDGSVPEKVGINLSGSNGLYFNSGASYGLSVKASSTGGIAIDSDNFLYVNGANNFIFSGTNQFTGSNTVVAGSGSLYVPTPTDPGQATNMSYVDLNRQANAATGTAGVNVYAGQLLYVSSTTNLLFLADADMTTTSYPFVGVALNTTNTGGIITYARPGGIVYNQANMTSGTYQYISDTAGATSSPRTTGILARIGYAITTSTMLVLQPTFNQIRSSMQTLTFNDTPNEQVIGFVPRRVDVLCIGTSQANSNGFWVWDSSGAPRQFGRGTDDDAVPYEMTTTTASCAWEEGVNGFGVRITTTTRGFSLTGHNNGGGGNRDVYWIAQWADNGAATP